MISIITYILQLIVYSGSAQFAKPAEDECSCLQVNWSPIPGSAAEVSLSMVEESAVNTKRGYSLSKRVVNPWFECGRKAPKKNRFLRVCILLLL